MRCDDFQIEKSHRKLHTHMNKNIPKHQNLSLCNLWKDDSQNLNFFYSFN